MGLFTHILAFGFLAFNALQRSALDQSVALIDKKIARIKQRFGLPASAQVGADQPPSGQSALLTLLAQPTSCLLSSHDTLVIYNNASLYFVNETNILLEHPLGFNTTAKVFVNDFSFGPSSFLVLDEAGRSAAIVSIPAFNKTHTKRYRYLNATFERTFSVNNLLLVQNGRDVLFTTLDQGALFKIAELEGTGERIVTVLRTDILYYIFSDRALYFIDSYNLQVRKIDNLPARVRQAAFFKVAHQSFLATVDARNRLLVYQLQNKFEIAKAKRIPFRAERVALFGKFLVVTRAREFRVFSLAGILTDAPAGVSLLRVSPDQFVWSVEGEPDSLRVFTRSRTAGLLTYLVSTKAGEKEPPSLFASLGSLASSKYLILLSIPLFVCIFAYVKIQKTNKEQAAAELKKKQEVEKLLRAHKRQMETLTEQVKNISSRVEKVAQSELGEIQRKVEKLR